MSKTILLIDDDLDDTEIFEEALTEINPAILFYKAENGQDAFNKLQGKEVGQPDIIFLDVNMPGMNGWQFLTKLKTEAAYHNIPVIMYSTSSAKKDIAIAEDLGAVGFLTKPADYKGLKKALLLLLAQTSPDGLRQSVEDIKKMEWYS
ncbi:response regulator [Chitinophaga sp.]|uniref:response regulator n=1 Tax=Chitinophaga sp. TaxID=1869181 RepID=UPI002632A06E|nr:response regulator [uncultured Chitinophaga sp.]